mgnify:CR=1 FL=1
MTAFEDTRDGVNILQSGGADYLFKPIKAESLEHLFIRLFEKARVEHENEEPSPFLGSELGDVPFVHAGDRIREVLNSVSRSRDSSATVLITGESGTGKELIARMIHDSSARRESIHRRGGGHSPEHPGKAFTGPPVRADPACRGKLDPDLERPHHSRHQPEPQESCRTGPISVRPLLEAERNLDRDNALSETQGRRPRPCLVVPTTK